MEKELKVKITVNQSDLVRLKESTKVTVAEIKALNNSLVAEVKAQAQIKVQAEKTAQTQIKADAQKTVIELKATKQKEVIDYKDAINQKLNAERKFEQDFKSLLAQETQADKQASNQKKQTAKEEAEFKKLRSQEILKYNQQAYAEELAFKKSRSQNILNTNTKRDSGLSGQSVTLGSEQAIKEQIKYWNQYKSTLAGTDPQLQNTIKHINQLKTSLNQVKGGGASRSDWEHWENLTTVFLGMAVAIGATAKALFNFGSQALKSAAELEVYGKKFIELAGNEAKARQQLELLRQASTGNLNDIELIKYSNKMQLLGISAMETAQLLDIVERKADDVGVAFSEGESALQSFILTGRGKALKELGINIIDVQNEMQRLTGFTQEQIDKMGDEDKQVLRTNALLSRYGSTIDEINKKQKDTGDRIQSLSTGWENLKTTIGSGLIEPFNAVYRLFDKIGVKGEVLDKVLVQMVHTLVQPPWYSFPKILGDIADKAGAVGNAFFLATEPLLYLLSLLSRTEKEFPKTNTGGFGDLKILDASANSGTTSNTEADRDRQKGYWEDLKKNAQIGSENYKYYTEQLKQFETQTKKTTNSSRNTSKEVSTITNEIIRLNKSLADLTAEQLSLGESAKGTSIFAIYLQQIQEIQDKLKYLNSPFKDSTGLDFITNLPKYDNSQNIQGQELSFAEQVNLTGIDKEAMQKEAYDKIVNGSQQALSNVENIFQILDIGTETFVSKLVSGFQSALSIIDTIKQVLESINSVKQGIGILSSLLSFVPGGGFIGTATAGFGNLSGGGRNIGNLSTGGGQSPMVNKIYINSTLDTQKFFGDGVTTFYKNRNLNTVG